MYNTAMSSAENELRGVRRARWVAPLLAVAGYTLLTLVFSWPLPLHLADGAVLARGSDFYPHIWNLWWMRYSLFSLHQNPYFTTYLNYPTGQPLTYHVLDPVDGIASLPLQAAVGLVAAFNLLRLVQIVFAATAVLALCRLMRLPWLAAWAGGALFAFCPLVGTSFDLGQLVEISVGWIPLYILCLIRALGNRALGMPAAAPLWLAGAALSLAASALSTWYFFTALVLFTALYVTWEAGGIWWESSHPLILAQGTVEKSQWRPAVIRLIARAAIVGAVALFVLGPLIIALLQESATGADYTVTPLGTVIRNSADLLSFFLPLPARLTIPTINPHGNNPALGWTAMLLALAGLLAGGRFGRSHARRPPTASQEKQLPLIAHGPLRFWLAVALVFSVLALGPRLLVGGFDTGVPMPYALLNKLPFIGAARVPLRFTLLVSLAVAVLAAYGLVAIARTLRTSRARNTLFIVVALLIAVEFFNIPRTMISTAIDPFYTSIQAQNGTGSQDAVLELPYDATVASAMLDQTAHQRPILGGYTARHYPYPWIRATPGVAHLTQFGTLTLRATDIITPQVRDTALQALDYYGVRYVAVHPLGDEGIDRKTALTLETIFEAHNIAPVYTDTTLTAYKVPPQPQNRPIVGLGDGWYLQQESGPRIWRWSNGQATVQITNPMTAMMQANLRLSAFAVSSPRTMAVLLDGKEIGRQKVGPTPAQQATFALELTPGEHWLELRSLEPPQFLPNDPRPTSLGFEQIAVEMK